MADFTSAHVREISESPLWAAAGDILYATADDAGTVLTIGDTNAVLQVSDGLPAWSTGALAVDSGGTGATTLTDKAVLISQDSGTDTVGSVALTTSGQVIIGGSSGPQAATLTEGANVTITNGDGSISIAAAGGPSLGLVMALS